MRNSCVACFIFFVVVLLLSFAPKDKLCTYCTKEGCASKNSTEWVKRVKVVAK